MLRVKIMSKTDNETINRHIHEMLGKCWHRFEPYRAIHGNDKCLENCGATRYTADRSMDYCSDDSPRRLLNEAVDKAVEMVGARDFTDELIIATTGTVWFDGRLDVLETLFAAARATNQQIATAIYNATQEEGK
jgi:hypothetical protein